MKLSVNRATDWIHPRGEYVLFKILITGSRGQLGLELIKQLEGARAIDAQVLAVDLPGLDIADERSVFSFCQEKRPDVIVNCAAYTNVDSCENNETLAFRVNAIGARNLAAAAFDINAKILQVSTDYVFDGTGNSPKREYDPINPLSVYGKSKALGEQMVREVNPRHFILRTAWLYGEGSNFVRTMLQLANEQNELNVVDDQFGSPTSTVDLARCILKLIQTNSYGTYHGTCEGSCSWHEFAQTIFSFKGLDIKVNPIQTEALNRPAPRPRYSILENFMLDLIGMNTFRSWQDALKEYLQQ